MFRSLSVEEIANNLSTSFIGKNQIIKGVNTLKNANENEISFFTNSKYRQFLLVTNAGACLIKEDDIELAPENVTKIICKNPYLAYAKVLDMLYVNEIESEYIASSAHIAKSAKVGKNCSIQHNVVIDENAEVGNDCIIGSSTYIGKNVRIGNGVRIASNVSLIACEIGNDCILHSGVRIGQDGFGFVLNEHKQMQKIKQIGKVIIGNDVEIGANSCIDRGAIDNTIIGNNTKIDNLVQIGHNVIIGSNCVLCAQVGIAGSTVIGDYVEIGGQAGLNGHIKIGSMCGIAAKSGVMRDLENKERVGGSPAVSITDWHRQTIFLQNAIKK